jgi:twitching motility protein PilU
MVDWRNENSFGHIITMEDPVEFVHMHKNCVVTQREVGLDTDSWEAALKNTLRQAPDVILMGEIRDRETMEHAVAFAETGHLCMATLHANSANQALDRIINFFPEERRTQLLMDLSLNLRGMISQRLIPKQDMARAAGCGGSDAQHPADCRPDLQGRGGRDQGDHEEEPQPGHADLRPGAVRRLREQPDHLRRRLRNADSVNDLRLQIKLKASAPKHKTWRRAPNTSPSSDTSIFLGATAPSRGSRQ